LDVSLNIFISREKFAQFLIFRCLPTTSPMRNFFISPFFKEKSQREKDRLLFMTSFGEKKGSLAIEKIMSEIKEDELKGIGTAGAN
jgi:hypothetical protein